MIRTLLLLLLLIFSAFIGSASAAEVALCTQTGDQIHPDVFGQYVVWEDHRDGVSRVYLYDAKAGTGAPIPLTESALSQAEPAIFGDSVVYISQSKAEYEVRLYSIADKTSIAVRSSTDRLETPDVYSTADGVAVVWTEHVQNDPHGAPNSDIWLYTESRSGLERTARVSEGGYESNPRIDQGQVVWMHKAAVPGLDSYRGPYDVYARTGSAAPVRISTTTAGDRNLLPDVSSNRTVWQDSDAIDDYGADVLLSKLPRAADDPVVLKPRPTETPVATRAFRQPAIWGDTVAYVDSDMAAYSHVLKVTRLGTDVEYGLSASTHAAYPRIHGDTVVWQDNRAGSWDIYVASAAPIPVTGCTVITDPGYYYLANDIVDSPCLIAIEIRSSGVLLDGRDHMIDGVDAWGHYGEDSARGIYIRNEPLTLRDVAVRDVRLTDWGVGIAAYRCDDTQYRNIAASSGNWGISPGIGNNCLIESCTFLDNGAYGINVDTNNTSIENCTALRNGYSGVKVYGADRVVVRDSEIRMNRRGVEIAYAHCDIYDSTISANNITGIEIGNGVHFEAIAGNRISGNPCGIEFVVPEFEGGEVIYNNYLNNIMNVDWGTHISTVSWSAAERPGPNIIDGPSIGGNYWGQSNLLGFSQTHADADGDGFCDEAYTINAGLGGHPNVDLLPLRRPSDPTRPLLMLPGVQLYPLDLDQNGKFEDTNGNGRKDFADIVLYFNQMSWIAANEPMGAFDYNGNDRIDFADVVSLFTHL